MFQGIRKRSTSTFSFESTRKPTARFTNSLVIESLEPRQLLAVDLALTGSADQNLPSSRNGAANLDLQGPGLVAPPVNMLGDFGDLQVEPVNLDAARC